MFFLFQNFGHPQEDFVKFGYKSKRKIEKFRDSSYVYWQYIGSWNQVFFLGKISTSLPFEKMKWKYSVVYSK